MFKFIKKLIDAMKNDPVKYCRLYKETGCSHVDGFLCDYPKCDMLKEYNGNKIN
jgi:hypothetical protein